MPAPSTSPHMSTHRWPWRAEEFVSMALVLLLCVGGGYLTHTLIWLTVGTLSGLGGVYALYRLKTGRVARSQVTVTIEGTTVRTESKGSLGMSAADVAKAESIDTRRFGSDETFVISDGTKAVRIPLRATTDKRVRAAVETAFANAKHIDPDARALLRRTVAEPSADRVEARIEAGVKNVPAPSGDRD